MKLEEKIKNFIKEKVLTCHNKDDYREPLVGFASADDELFKELKNIIGPHVAHPKELLPEAETVVSFFIPFNKEIALSNRKDTKVSKKWAEIYIDTNKIINEICSELVEKLSTLNIKGVTEKATHNFDEKNLTAKWSHKSVAYIAGLGKFGLNKMLITPKGCAGRFGSIVISYKIPPTPRKNEEFCFYKKNGSCLYCVDKCPTKALTKTGINKKVCYKQLLSVADSFKEIGFADVCGKCAVGPCSYLE